MKKLFNVFELSFLKKLFTKSKIVFPILLLSVFIQLSCDTAEPPTPPLVVPTPKAVTLKLIDVSCTEAFIKVNAADSVLPVTITVSKDNNELYNFTLTKTDTVIIDNTLQPNSLYIYQTTEQINSKEEKSDTIQVKTLPITSSNFIWQTFAFGEPLTGGSCNLNDVFIINENDIWAVGEIYLDDSGLPYNAVHWDGTKWEAKRITVNFRDNLITPPLHGVFCFSATDIWMAGSLPIHGNGIEWTLYDIRTTVDPNLSVAKAWGSNTNDIYFVGNLGSIAHYYNGIWNKLESGTESRFNDIWGYYNEKSGNTTVLTVSSELMTISDHRLISITGNQAKDTLDYPYNRKLRSVWFKNNNSPIYVSGSDLMKYYKGKWQLFDLSDWVIHSMRGNDVNDIVVIDAQGVFYHYNGMEWDKDESLIDKYGFESIAIKNNTVVIVGTVLNGGLASEAVIMLGKRAN